MLVYHENLSKMAYQDNLSRYSITDVGRTAEHTDGKSVLRTSIFMFRIT